MIRKDLNFKVPDDFDTVRHEIKTIDDFIILYAYNEGGHCNTSTDIKKFLLYVSKEFPALYMENVTNEMMVTYT
jgi:hypothetical protein